MKKITATIAILLTLTGCKRPQEDMAFYKCSGAQLDLIEREKKICENSGWQSSYCFEQAKLTQCDYIPGININ